MSKRSHGRRFTWALPALPALQALMAVSVAAAQMPGAPVLQNAFTNPGITAALNIANLGGASSYGLAGAWAPTSGRFQLSAGVGAQTRSDTPNRTVYGARVNVPVYSLGSALGFSVFAGYGGLSGGELDSTVAKSLLPVGGTVSYRLGIGTTRGISIYGSPIYEWIGRGDGAGNTSLFRGALGLDVSITSRIGATVGVEIGAKQEEGSGKPSGTAFGAALSMVLGGRS